MTNEKNQTLTSGHASGGRVTYICHPYRSDPEMATVAVAEICRRLVADGHLPIAPQLFIPSFLDDSRNRAEALRLCLWLLTLSDQVAVYGRPTEGMRLELAHAERLRIPVVFEQR